MTEISIKTIEKSTTSSNLERGKSYYKSGQVQDFNIINNHLIQATVNGGKKYKVFLEVLENGYKSYCTCPYDSKGYCKHQVAVKLALMNPPDNTSYINLPQNQELLLKYFNRALSIFYKVRYKLF
jgi:uncharacterized Zn finger protein